MGIKAPEKIEILQDLLEQDQTSSKQDDILANTHYGGRKWYQCKRKFFFNPVATPTKMSVRTRKYAEHSLTYHISKWPLNRQQNQAWARHRYQEFKTLEEKIAQLILIPVTALWEDSEDILVKMWIQHEKIAGLCFTGGEPLHQFHRINEYQKMSPLPLLMVQDTQVNLQPCFDPFILLPNKELLLRLTDRLLLYESGLALGEILRELGLEMLFLNLKNQREEFLLKPFLSGLVYSGITYLYSNHAETPNRYELGKGLSKKEVEQTKYVIRLPCGIFGCHLLYGSQLSKWKVADLRNLEDNTAFISRMLVKSLVNDFDAVLIKGDIPAIIEHVKQSVLSGECSVDLINAKLVKMLLIKQYFGRQKKRWMPKILNEHICHAPKIRLLKRRIYEKVMTAHINDHTAFPINPLKIPALTYLHIGRETHLAHKELYKAFSLKVNLLELSLDVLTKPLMMNLLLKKIRPQELIVLSINPGKQGIDSLIEHFIKKLVVRHKELIVIYYGKSYNKEIYKQAKACLIIEEDNPEAELSVIDALLGRFKLTH